jgi:hypothetical protein
VDGGRKGNISYLTSDIKSGIRCIKSSEISQQTPLRMFTFKITFIISLLRILEVLELERKSQPSSNPDNYPASAKHIDNLASLFMSTTSLSSFSTTKARNPPNEGSPRECYFPCSSEGSLSTESFATFIFTFHQLVLLQCLMRCALSPLVRDVDQGLSNSTPNKERLGDPWPEQQDISKLWFLYDSNHYALQIKTNSQPKRQI